MSKKINENVIYIEPNFTYSKQDSIVNSDKAYELAPPLEDYCITVDLEVTIPNRKDVGISKVMKFSWSSTPNGDSKISFFSGSKENFGNSKESYYLTSNPTVFGTYDDIKNNGTNECFGIKSIDIQYRNYSIPEVTIEFVDIRGISLFASEESRRNSNGEYYSNDESNGSFFKCFFSFPYPTFHLMVKGFYGEPVVYELTVSDFRASFDCNTGNFNATAKFVGYAFSFLNDVTLNALTVAPMEESYGSKYWDKNTLETKRFVFDDGHIMPTINDVIKKINDVKTKIEQVSSKSELAIKNKDLSDISIKINNINTYNNSLFSELNKFYSKIKNKTSYSNNIVYSKNKSIVYFYKEDKNVSQSNKVSYDNEIITTYNKFKDVITEYDKSLKIPSLNINDTHDIIPKSYNKEENIKFLNKIIPNYKSIVGDDFFKNDNTIIKFYYFDSSELMNKINKIKENIDNEVKSNSKSLSKLTQTEIEKILGFTPSVKNICKLLMAHFETLVYSIYACAKNVKPEGRTLQSLGITETDLKDEYLGPFPSVKVNKPHSETSSDNISTIETLEDEWLGDLANGYNQPEVQLIEGMLAATSKFKSTLDEVVSKQLSDNGYLEMYIPVSPIDIVFNKLPFDVNDNKKYGEVSETQFTEISDFIGKIALRFLSLKASNFKFSNYEKIGIADAHNFKKQFPSISSVLLKKLCENENTLNPNLIEKILTNDSSVQQNSGYKPNTDWAWDFNDVSKGLIKSDKLNLYLHDLDNGKQTRIVPLFNFNWENIKNINNGSSEEFDFNDFLTTNYNNVFCNNIFKIIKDDYNKFSYVKSYMKINGETFDYVENLNLEFNPTLYFDTYFDKDPDVFGEKFKSKYINFNFDFSGKENTCTLPRERATDKQSVVKAFKLNKNEIYTSLFGDDFDFIKDENNIKYNRSNKSFLDAINEVDDVINYTIPSFKGVRNDASCTNEFSVFGDEAYYLLHSNYEKGVVFLMSLMEDNDDGGIKMQKFIDYLRYNKCEPFTYVPYPLILAIGGLLWNQKYNDNLLKKHGFDVKVLKINLRHEIIETLINEFKNWVDNSDDGFGYIQSQFELSQRNGSQIGFIYNILSILNGKKRESFDEYLYYNANDNLYRNYLTLYPYNDSKLKLYNREDSEAVSKLTDFYVKPCLIVFPTKYNSSNNTNDVSFIGFNKYLTPFLKTLRELYNDEYKSNTFTINKVEASNVNKHIKISLYNYIKIIYDKWLCGIDEKFWKLESFFDNKWYFIDSYYNKIGSKIPINVIQFSNDIIYSQEQNGYSLLSFIVKMLSTNRFGFYCVQNFFDFSDNNVERNKLMNLFKAIPYEKIDFANINKHPSFIVMYSYEYSSKLDMKDSQYKSDSFDLDNEDSLPIPIKLKTKLCGYKIPSFGVSYGKQYQSYFKDINVSMDNPMVTEQSIRTQYNIANQYSKNNSENGKKYTLIGQDLYTIYSNNSYTCTVKMMGCAWIQPLMYFQLTNVPMFRGAYLIQRVNHHIEPGNMETTFVGTRMSKSSTPIVDNIFILSDNDQTYSNSIDKENEYKKAEITNNCEYKFFNPLINTSTNGMTEEELNMNCKQYERHVGSKFKEDVKKSYFQDDNRQIIDLLGCIAYGESNVCGDDLSKQLILTVLFNRYMYNKKDLTKVIYGNHFEYKKSDDYFLLESSKINHYRQLVREIFLNSPLILLKHGKNLTTVKNSVNIWKYGIKTEEKTKPIELTSEILKKIDGYCTILGYDKPEPNKSDREPLGYWHNGLYLCQHDGNVGNYGHVFVNGAFNGFKNKEYWKESTTVKTNNKISEKANNLYSSILSTLNYSDEIKYNDIKLIECSSDKDSFYITASPNNIMCTIFDIIVNTYYDYISECYWIVNNDTSEEPYRIKVKFDDNSVKKKICIATLNCDKIKVCKDYKNLNSYFYTTLRKKYYPFNNENKNIFKLECLNFSSLISTNNKWEDEVSEILNVKLIDCHNGNNIPFNSDYSFNVNNHLADNNEPKIKFNEYNITAATSKAIENVTSATSKGNCAKYVRMAIEAGGKNFNGNTPYSACNYGKFLSFAGFKQVYPNSSNYTPKNGDISVISADSKHKYGHIQMYCECVNGNYWVSDYKGISNNPYGDNRPYIIYRWYDNKIV